MINAVYDGQQEQGEQSEACGIIPNETDRAEPLPAERPNDFTRCWIQGVEYFRSQPAGGGDLFLTRYGLPFARQLQPENWFVPEWFAGHRRRLRGTSTIYQVQTKPDQGRSLAIVVRFNRVGEDLPIDTITRDAHMDATFSSPFEEVAELMALRAARFGSERRRVPTKRPLAIYSPAKRLELWQTGRSESIMAIKQAQHQGITLDIERQYILLYGWIKGIDMQDATDKFGIVGASRESLQASAVAEVERDLKQAGFRVVDMKPAHIIVRFAQDGSLLRRKDGRLVYALVDYELLEPIRVAS
jgi:hypothetical protein